MKTVITTGQYIEAIENALKTEGVEVADTMNKLALEMEAITLDQYLMAAHILVDAVLNR